VALIRILTNNFKTLTGTEKHKTQKSFLTKRALSICELKYYLYITKVNYPCCYSDNIMFQ